jgi:hypothetical protein
MKLDTKSIINKQVRNAVVTKINNEFTTEIWEEIGKQLTGNVLRDIIGLTDYRSANQFTLQFNNAIKNDAL